MNNIMNKTVMPAGKRFALLALNLSLGVAAWAADPPNTPPGTNAPTNLPVVAIVATDPTALVGTSSAAFTFLREGDVSSNLVVQYTISGSGSNGVDYAKIDTQVTIPAGFQATDLLIQPLIDTNNPGNKTVTLTLQGTTGDGDRRGHARATVLLVDNVYNDQPPTVTLTQPTNGTVFNLPAVVPILATANDADGLVSSVSFFANDRFLGRVTNSPFALNWTNPPGGNYTLFARAIDNAGKSTLSTPVDISVQAPTLNLSITSPTNGQVFTVPANVGISVAVTGTATVDSLEIYGDQKLLASLTQAPYTTTWTNVPPGWHFVQVRATDQFHHVTSTYVRFRVTTVPPVVTLTAPTNGANFTAHSNITLSADASSSVGTVASVTFWAGDHFLGRVDTAPYTVTWNNVPPGLYTLTAVATDNQGIRAVSSPVLISVSR